MKNKQTTWLPPHPGKFRRSDGIMLGAVLMVGFITRLVYFWHVHRQIWFNYPIIDSWNFHTWAEKIAAGKLLGIGIFTPSPLYAYGLGAIYSIFGSQAATASALQLFLGVIGCGLIYLLGRRCFSPMAGLLAGLASAVYGISMFYEGSLLALTLINILNLLILLTVYWAARRSTWTAWLLPGFLLGLSIITRSNIMLLLLVLAAWIGLQFRGQRNWKAIFLPLAGLVIGSFFVMAPLLIRNMVVPQQPMFTINTIGLNFHLGNSMKSTGYLKPEGLLGRSSLVFADDYKKEAERRMGRSLSYKESSRYWLGQTLKDIGQDPERWQQLLMDKLLFFFNYYEITNNLNYYFIRKLTPVLRLPWLTFGILCPFALLGIVLFRQRWPELLPLYGYLFIYLLANVFLVISSEYRYAVVPVFFILGAGAVMELAGRIWKKQWAKLALPGIILVFFGLLSNIGFLSYEAHNYRQAAAHCNFGKLLEKSGDTRGAIREYAAARKWLPHHVEPVFYHGKSLILVGQFEQALSALEEAYNRKPNLLSILDALGDALTLTNKYPRALQIRREAVALYPDNPGVFHKLGITYLAAGNTKQADQAFKQELKLDPSRVINLQEIMDRIKYNQSRETMSEPVDRPNIKGDEVPDPAQPPVYIPPPVQYQAPIYQPPQYQPPPPPAPQPPPPVRY